MIKRVTIRNLKRFKEQSFDDLQQLHLLVGQNNSGKSTLLHALAIWNYCVEEFRASDRTGSKKAIELTLANFTPLPLSDFRLLWHEKTERSYPLSDEIDPATKKPKKRQEFVYVEIEVTWRKNGDTEKSFAVLLRWHTRNTVYASPKSSWEDFRKLDADGDVKRTNFPRMVYVPPSSNIAAQERPLDTANLRALVGEGRPGSVVRNMIWLTYRAQKDTSASKRFETPFTLLRKHIEDWFGIHVNDPEYVEGRSRFVVSTYLSPGKLELDWVNAGSGLLQCLIVLTFLYGFQPDVLLLDEPDAHLHVNLQRTLLDFLKRQMATQMLIATHAEEFILRVNPDQISFLTPFGVKRVTETQSAKLALSEISNLDLLNLIARKVFVYVEGETDEELLRGWAAALQRGSEFKALLDAIQSTAFIPLRGGSADEMLQFADRHFKGCKFISDEAERILVLDRNDGKWLKRAEHDPKLFVWSKRHIESYLLVPTAWERAARWAAESQFPIAGEAAAACVRDFFKEQSRGLQVDWLNPKEELFRDINAKRLLFEARKSRDGDYDALTSRLHDQLVVVARHDVASVMQPAEIHEDVKAVFRLILNAVTRQVAQ